MAFLGILIGKLLDPFSFIAALVIAYQIKKWWMIPVVGIVIAVCAEALLVSLSFTRQFGHSLVVGFIASSIHVSLAFLATQKFKSRRINSVSKEGPPNIAAQEEAEDLGAEFQTPQERMSENLGIIFPQISQSEIDARDEKRAKARELFNEKRAKEREWADENKVDYSKLAIKIGELASGAIGLIKDAGGAVAEKLEQRAMNDKNSTPDTGSNAQDDIEGRLEKLSNLHKQGHISDEEFSQQRSRILDEV